jgi:hypothetical protein
LEVILDVLIQEEGRFTQSQLAVSWAWVMEKYWLLAGPKIWKILKKVFKWVSDDIKVRNNENEIGVFLKGEKM